MLAIDEKMIVINQQREGDSRFHVPRAGGNRGKIDILWLRSGGDDNAGVWVLG